MEATQDRHDEFWKGRKALAEERLHGLLDGADSVEDVIGKENPENEHDIRMLLAYVLRHGACTDKACAIISSTRWVQACDELAEHH